MMVSPALSTWATPSMVDRVGAIRFSANSLSSDRSMDGDVNARISTGAPVSQAGANGTARATSADGVPGNTKAAEARP